MTEEARNKRLAEFSPEEVALGRVVRASVAEGLEHQRGRAAGAFRAALQDPAFRMAGESKPKPTFALKLWAGTASAIAACLAVVLTAQFLMKPTQITTNPPEVAASPMVVDQVLYTRNIDGGTIVLDDNTPARIVMQQQLKQTEWFDQKEKATYSVTQPIQTVQYRRLQPF